MKPLPYRFEGDYAECYLNSPATSMDPRHIFILHEILMGYPFKETLEIGSFAGASATAFVEAIHRGANFHATFCDVVKTPSLCRVLGSCWQQNQISFFREPSTVVLDRTGPFDFIFVDANHDLQSVIPEMARLVLKRPLCVMAHDTHATEAGYSLCEGAALLRTVFQNTLGYRCLEDAKDRPGELTKRGLFLATRDADVYRMAQRVFGDWA